VDGETEIFKRENKLGDQERHFCRTCGTTVYWAISTLPGFTGIAGGCFAETPLPAPTVTLSNEEKCPWIELPQDLRTRISRSDFGS
jgi:hypothetical protein